MESRDRYLAEVGAQLTLPDEPKAEILEELAAHLGDSVAGLREAGREPQTAEAEALARFGPPSDLARALVAAHRSPTQLLAAAGAGTWAAITSGGLGSIAGWLVVVLATVLGSAAAEVASDVFGSRVGVEWTGGWNAVLTAVGLSVGAFAAGAAAVRSVARRSWRAAAEVRVAVAMIGVIVLAYLALVRLEQALNWASVIALLLVPVAFVAGTRVEAFRLPGVRSLGVLLLAGASVVLAANVGTGLSGGQAESYWWNDETHGYEMVAPWWHGSSESASADFPSREASRMNPAITTMTIEATSERVLAQFRSFRLEAWLAESPRDGWRLLPGQSGPFAVAPALVDGTAVSGTLRFNQVPGVDWAQVVLTAVGPDGRRYLLSGSGPEKTEFYGSVWSWFAALVR